MPVIVPTEGGVICIPVLSSTFKQKGKKGEDSSNAEDTQLYFLLLTVLCFFILLSI